MKSNTQSQPLVKAGVISVVVAALALVLVILPAEYNVDPTGVGEKLGLTVFNQPQAPTSIATSEGDKEDRVAVLIPAGRGVEYKLAVEKFSKVTYEWSVDAGSLYVDLHGEPQGDTTGYFESYTIATVDKMKGSFTAPFAGSHGWYWKNKSDKDITVTLNISGDYVVEGLK